jgi:hypothetical protein
MGAYIGEKEERSQDNGIPILQKAMDLKEEEKPRVYPR